MNNIQTYIENQKKLFAEKITPVVKLGYPNSPNLANALTSEFDFFLDHSLKGLLEVVGKEAEGMKLTLPKGRCLNAENHLFGKCFQCEKTTGYNSALDQIISLTHLEVSKPIEK